MVFAGLPLLQMEGILFLGEELSEADGLIYGLIGTATRLKMYERVRVSREKRTCLINI